jgi:hypothetical protein
MFFVIHRVSLWDNCVKFLFTFFEFKFVLTELNFSFYFLDQ